jgi:large subunit ribosomal protein L10
MNKNEKNAAVAEIEQSLGRAENAFVVGFSGIKVPEVTELRRQIRETHSSYLVVKNTLALRAIKSGKLAPLAEHFSGPTAVAFNDGSPVALAKVLTNFAKTNAALAFKGAVVEGQVISLAEIKAIAELPSREQLVARLIGVLQSPLRRLVTVLHGPAHNFVAVLAQVAEQKGKNAPAGGSAPGEPLN